MRYKFTDLYIKHYCAKQANAVAPVYTYSTPSEEEAYDPTMTYATTGGFSAISGTVGGINSARNGNGFISGFTKGALSPVAPVGFINGKAKTAELAAKFSKPFRPFARFIASPWLAAGGAVWGAGEVFNHNSKVSDLDGQDFVNQLNKYNNDWGALTSWGKLFDPANGHQNGSRALDAIMTLNPLDATKTLATLNYHLQTKNILDSLKHHEVNGFVDNGRWGDLFFGLFGNKKTTAGYRDFAQQAQARGFTGSADYYNALTNAHDKGTQLDSNKLSELEDGKFYYDSVARKKMNPSMTFDKFRQFRAYKRNTGSRLTQQEFLSGNISADTHNTDQKNRLDKEYAKLEAQRTA